MEAPRTLGQKLKPYGDSNLNVGLQKIEGEIIRIWFDLDAELWKWETELENGEVTEGFALAQ